MLNIGLTGGIGAGKSAVSALLAGEGAAVVDADLTARDVLAGGTAGLAAVVAEFGPQILDAAGTLDRAALAALVFADDAARNRLNALVHPLIGRRTAELIATARRSGAHLLVHDVPLLVENGLGPAYHLVVVVDAPLEVRLARLLERGLPPDQARRRIAAQADDAQRRAAADVWLDNPGSREALSDQVLVLLRERLVPYADNLGARRGAGRGPVVLVSYDPGWPAAADRLMARLRHLGGSRIAGVEHVGSTAVPGLISKNILDIEVTVTSWGVVEALEDVLAEGGFPRRPGVDSDPVRSEIDPEPAQWRKHLHRAADPGRQANVHVRVAGTAAHGLAVRFRDALRADAWLRESYAAEKRRLADLYAADVEAYAEAKTPFVLAAARAKRD